MKKILLFILGLSLSVQIAFAGVDFDQRPSVVSSAQNQPDDLRESFGVAYTGKSLVVSLCPPEAMSGKASLMNIVGQVVEEWNVEFEQSGTQTKKLNVSKNHPSGIYIFTMQIDGKTLSRRVII